MVGKIIHLLCFYSIPSRKTFHTPSLPGFIFHGRRYRSVASGLESRVKPIGSLGRNALPLPIPFSTTAGDNLECVSLRYQLSEDWSEIEKRPFYLGEKHSLRCYHCKSLLLELRRRLVTVAIRIVLQRNRRLESSR